MLLNMRQTTMAIGSRTASARKAAGMTIREAAEWSGIARTHICAIERGRNEPRVSTLIKLADTYGVMLSHLVGEAPLPELILNKRERAVLNAMRNGDSNE